MPTFYNLPPKIMIPPVTTDYLNTESLITSENAEPFTYFSDPAVPDHVNCNCVTNEAFWAFHFVREGSAVEYLIDYLSRIWYVRAEWLIAMSVFDTWHRYSSIEELLIDARSYADFVYTIGARVYIVPDSD